ncbi:MAG: 50S ribosomal protein L19 [Candidatus Kerfeldbacteria bacterium]|nr:50S ribosomal protein L19 [Candidatus Kerfeldbacteria bacterium]
MGESPSTEPRFDNIKPGQLIKVHQKIKELNAKGEEKERIQIFEGMVLSRHGGRGVNSTITVRKVSDGVGVERIFPLYLPTIAEIEVVKTYRTNRAKLYYLRGYTKKLKEVATSKSKN